MRSFAQVDVFTAHPGSGNPVAVVLDAEGLSDDEMARFANWTNLSETTFVLPATSTSADYRLRIFTPSVELPFAGHPTLGSCRALLDAGRLTSQQPSQQSWVQECGAGLVTVRRSAVDPDGTAADPASAPPADGPAAELLSFAAPVPDVSDAPMTAGLLARTLGGPPPDDVLLIDVGPRWITGRIDVDGLDSLTPDATAVLRELDPRQSTGITLYAVDDERCVHVRSFFASAGQLAEDPVCGSGNAAVAVHLTRTGHTGDVPGTYRSHQGRHRGRDGRITVTLGDPIWVGGQAVTVVTGSVGI